MGRIGCGTPRAGERVIRVDRASGSDLGNPFPVADPSDAARELACIAYERLLEATDRGGTGAPETPGRVAWIGRMVGWEGRFGARDWDWDAARGELQRLRRLLRVSALRLDCHCHPRQCHAETIAVHLLRRPCGARCERAPGPACRPVHELCGTDGGPVFVPPAP